MERPDFRSGRRRRGGSDRVGFRDGRDGSHGSLGRGGARGGRGRRGRGRGRGGGIDGANENKVIVESHRHPGLFIARSKNSDMLVTRNMVVGESVYDEKLISVDGENQEKIEYRVWNPFQSKLAAAIIGGIDHIHISLGTRVLYLGAASGKTVSHISDIVGPYGLVYAVEISDQSGRALSELAKKRTNIIPIIEDARHPHKYQTLIDTVDTIVANIAQPDQVHILALNAHQFLKNGGHFIITINASCIDSTVASEVVFAGEVEKLRHEKFKPHEQLTLEPYERDHAVVVGVYQSINKSKNTEE